MRHATHRHHQRLNRHPLLVTLTQRDLSLINYRKLLIAYFHLYAALETQICQFLKRQTVTFDYAGRRKLPWLINDLAYFRDDSPVSGQNKLPEPALPEIDRVGQLVGVLYTIEGSTLGGQLISRNLAEHHGLTRSKGACFFNGYGEHTTCMWQEFLDFAETISGNAHERRVAVESACRTFQLFEEVLDTFADNHNYGNFNKSGQPANRAATHHDTKPKFTPGDA